MKMNRRVVGIDRYLHFAVAINRIRGFILVQYLHHAMRLKDYCYETPSLTPSRRRLASVKAPALKCQSR